MRTSPPFGGPYVPVRGRETPCTSLRNGPQTAGGALALTHARLLWYCPSRTAPSRGVNGGGDAMVAYGVGLWAQTLLALVLLAFAGGWALWPFRRADRPYLWLAAPLAG